MAMLRSTTPGWKRSPMLRNAATSLVSTSPKAVSLRAAITKQRENGLTVHDEDIHHILLQQHPELREELQQLFPHSSFHQALRRAEFGKAQLPLNKAFFMRKLLVLGDSICRLLVGDSPVGTGFVLCDSFLLTNAHLFKDLFLEGREMELSVTVTAQFNYEDPTLKHLPISFDVSKHVIDIDFKMDYAVLWLNFKHDQTIPPGLLPHFGPTPKSGEVCIMGHHGGEVKTLDLTFVIGKEDREECKEQKLKPYDEDTKTILCKQLEGQHLGQIMTSDHVITYDTSMFYGSSGSPLFDAQCRVVGLHTAGFVYGFPEPKSYLIEYARSILDIFKNFLINWIRRNGDTYGTDLFEDRAQGNPHVIKILREVAWY